MIHDNHSPLMKRLAEIMPKKPEKPWKPWDGKSMMHIDLHPIRQSADAFTAWMNDDLPANREELHAMLWVFGEILYGEMERMLNVSNRLQSDLLDTLPIKPQMIHVSEIGEVTEERIKAMASVPPNPTLKFDHFSIPKYNRDNAIATVTARITDEIRSILSNTKGESLSGQDVKQTPEIIKSGENFYYCSGGGRGTMKKLTKEQIEEARKLFWEFEYDLPKDNEIERLAKVVQYAPTTGALTDEEWDELSGTTPDCDWTQVKRQDIDRILSRRTAEPKPAVEPSPALPCDHSWRINTGGVCPKCEQFVAVAPQPIEKTAEPSPAPVDAPSGDVIDRMCDAYSEAVNHVYAPHERAMTAAYNAAREHILAHPPAEWLEKRDAEWEKAAVEYLSNEHHRYSLLASCGMVKSIKMSIAKPAEKTPEERKVLVIAQIVSQFEGVTDSVEVADEILAALAELKGAGE